MCRKSVRRKTWGIEGRVDVCACYNGKKIKTDIFGKCKKCVDPDEFEKLEDQLI